MKIIISIIFSALLGAALLGGTLEMTKLPKNEGFYTRIVDKLTTNPSKRKVKFKVSFVGEIGKPERNCDGIGLGCLGLDVNITITPEFEMPPRTTNEINIGLNDNNTLTLEFFDTGDMTDKTLNVEKNYVLSSKICKAFEKDRIVIPVGRYPVKVLGNGFISVSVPYKE